MEHQADVRAQPRLSALPSRVAETGMAVRPSQNRRHHDHVGTICGRIDHFAQIGTPVRQAAIGFRAVEQGGRIRSADRYRVRPRFGGSTRARSRPRALLRPYIAGRASRCRGAHFGDPGAPRSSGPSVGSCLTAAAGALSRSDWSRASATIAGAQQRKPQVRCPGILPRRPGSRPQGSKAWC